MIKNYLAQFPNIKSEFLPTYSPELNLIETIWKTTRYNVTNSNYFPTIEKLKKRLENYWKKIILNLILQITYVHNYLTDTFINNSKIPLITRI